MSNLYLLLIIEVIGAIAFILGLLAGLVVKTYHHQRKYRLRVRQNRGEAIVSRIILANFKSPNYYLMNNITLAYQDGTTQIDHILISTKGVFVIETKNYSGWIFADSRSRQ